MRGLFFTIVGVVAWKTARAERFPNVIHSQGTNYVKTSFRLREESTKRCIYARPDSEPEFMYVECNSSSPSPFIWRLVRTETADQFSLKYDGEEKSAGAPLIMRGSKVRDGMFIDPNGMLLLVATNRAFPAWDVLTAPNRLVGIGANNEPITAPPPDDGVVYDLALGDGFLSGEAARWRGNTGKGLATLFFANWNKLPYLTDLFGLVEPAAHEHDPAGTDRTDEVYVEEYVDEEFCHRSMNAPVFLNAGFNEFVVQGTPHTNLACSQAKISDVIYRQADELYEFAKANHKIRSVSLLVGLSDFDLNSILKQCVEKFVAKAVIGDPSVKPCGETLQSSLEAKGADVLRDIREAIQTIKQVMMANQYNASNYRLVVLSYPVPLTSEVLLRPELRPKQSSNRIRLGGCPFLDEDFEPLRVHLFGGLNSILKNAAALEGVDYVDMGALFQGHEVCSRYTMQATGGAIDDTKMEWARYMWPGYTNGALRLFTPEQSGSTREFLHPNALGQQAMATCLKQHLALPAGNSTCTGKQNVHPLNIVVTRPK